MSGITSQDSLDTAFDVMGDIILSTAAQQYGGFTVPEVDKILEPYAEKVIRNIIKNFLKFLIPILMVFMLMLFQHQNI